MKKIFHFPDYTCVLLRMIIISFIPIIGYAQIPGTPGTISGTYADIDSVSIITTPIEHSLINDKEKAGIKNKKLEFENEDEKESTNNVMAINAVNSQNIRNGIGHVIRSTDLTLSGNYSQNRLTGQDPSFDFQGLAADYTNYAKSDPHGAAGLNHLVLVVNSFIGIFDKATGENLFTSDISTFFLKSPTLGRADPRVLYDAQSNHFFVVELIPDSGGIPNSMNCYIAVSKTANPQNGWWLYMLDADPSNANGFDYPEIGYNGSWFCLNFGIGGGRPNVFVLKKADLYAGGSVNYLSWTVPFSGNPAISYDLSSDRIYLANIINDALGQAGIIYIEGNNINPPATLNGPFIINSGIAWSALPYPQCGIDPITNCPYQYPVCGKGPPQLGTDVPLDPGGSGVLTNSIFRGGKLYFTHAACFPPQPSTTNRTSVLWWKVDPSNSFHLDTLAMIDDTTGNFSVHHPGIAVNSIGDVAVGYSISSSNIYTGASYSIFNSNGTYDSVIFKTSDTYVNACPFNNWRDAWSDYSATFVDPTDDKSMWTVLLIATGTPSNEKSRSWVGLIPEYVGCNPIITHGNILYTGNAKYEASNRISSARIISGSSIVDYDAQDSITLSPGFEAREGTRFHAYINGCGGLKYQSQPISSYASDNIVRNKLKVLPNPFSFTTNIEYTLVQDNTVDLKIYNIQMQLATTLVSNTQQQKGKHTLVFDASNLAVGVYICQLKTGDETIFKKLIRAK